MSLPALASLPAALSPLALRAEQSLQHAFAELSSEAAAAFAGWPRARVEALQRVGAASDFVVQQGLRDPQMLLDLAASGELERSLGAGELRGQLALALEACADDDELGRRLRRYRNRQQLRIIWRDISRQADLIETCRDLSDLADACIDLIKDVGADRMSFGDNDFQCQHDARHLATGGALAYRNLRSSCMGLDRD